MRNHSDTGTGTATAPAMARRTKPAATVDQVEDRLVLEVQAVAELDGDVDGQHQPEAPRQRRPGADADGHEDPADDEGQVPAQQCRPRPAGAAWWDGSRSASASTASLMK